MKIISSKKNRLYVWDYVTSAKWTNQFMSITVHYGLIIFWSWPWPETVWTRKSISYYLVVCVCACACACMCEALEVRDEDLGLSFPLKDKLHLCVSDFWEKKTHIYSDLSVEIFPPSLGLFGLWETADMFFPSLFSARLNSVFYRCVSPSRLSCSVNGNSPPRALSCFHLVYLNPVKCRHHPSLI